MKICYPLAIFCAILLLPLTAFGHHGKEFLVTSTYKTPDKGKSFLLLSFDYIQANHHGRGFELEPGVLYSIFDQWSAEIHTHHGLFNREFSFESIGVETQYRFFGAGDVQNEDHHQHDNSSPFSMAALLEFTKGVGASPDGLEGRLIIGKDIHSFSLVLNLIGEKIFERETGFEVRYALGMKYNLIPSVAVGIELDERLNHSTHPRMTPGLYGSLFRAIDFRVGASFPISSHSEGFSARTILIYSF